VTHLEEVVARFCEEIGKTLKDVSDVIVKADVIYILFQDETYIRVEFHMAEGPNQ
jgi:hypothetical protein